MTFLKWFFNRIYYSVVEAVYGRFSIYKLLEKVTLTNCDSLLKIYLNHLGHIEDNHLCLSTNAKTIFDVENNKEFIYLLRTYTLIKKYIKENKLNTTFTRNELVDLSFNDDSFKSKLLSLSSTKASEYTYVSKALESLCSLVLLKFNKIKIPYTYTV